MKTIHLGTEDIAAWQSALRDSRNETIVVYRGGYRILLGQGRVLSSSGHSEMDVTPVEMDTRRDKMHSNGRETDGGMSDQYKRRLVEAMTEETRDELWTFTEKAHYRNFRSESRQHDAAG